MSVILPRFLEYARYDQRLSEQTIEKYRVSILRFISIVGDGNIDDLTMQHFLDAKKRLFDQGIGESYIAGIIFALKSLLRYSRVVAGIQTMDPAHARPPRKPRRDVIYLTNEEVQQFLVSIRCHTFTGFRFRTMCEVLLGTAMRISEALSLDRDSIDYYRREARIVGKGNKERTVFFSDRSLDWIRKFLDRREDNYPAVFVTTGQARRLTRQDLSKYFRYYRIRSGLSKKVTPHILRHTAATNLLFNGCPISHVKEILGHDRLETTCKYYLGLDRKEAKNAHGQYLNYEVKIEDTARVAT